MPEPKPKPKCINVYFWGCYYHQHTPAPLPGWGTIAPLPRYLNSSTISTFCPHSMNPALSNIAELGLADIQYRSRARAHEAPPPPLFRPHTSRKNQSKELVHAGRPHHPPSGRQKPGRHQIGNDGLRRAHTAYTQKTREAQRRGRGFAC